MIERKLLPLHPRQNVIAGAVQDAIDALDRIAGETLAQRLDDRDAAGDRGLEGERDVLVFRQFRQRQPVLGEQRLVRGDDVLACRERRFHRGARGALIAAHQLDENVDVGRVRQRHRVVEHFERREMPRSRTAPAVTRMRRPVRA